MRRTVEMRQENIYYRGKKVDYLAEYIRNHFNITNSRVYKYVITIVEGTEYNFRNFSLEYFGLHIGNSFIGVICKEYFEKVFFRPDPKKRYNITVKKVRKNKTQSGVAPND